MSAQGILIWITPHVCLLYKSQQICVPQSLQPPPLHLYHCHSFQRCSPLSTSPSTVFIQLKHYHLQSKWLSMHNHAVHICTVGFSEARWLRRLSFSRPFTLLLATFRSLPAHFPLTLFFFELAARSLNSASFTPVKFTADELGLVSSKLPLVPSRPLFTHRVNAK